MTSVAPLAPPAAASSARGVGRFGAGAGRNLLVLIAAGLVWVALAFIDRRFLPALLWWNVSLLVLWAVDWWRLPAPGLLRAERLWPAPPALSVASPVVLTVRNASTTPLLARIVDTVPHRLRHEPPSQTAWIAGGGEAVVTYQIHPSARGETAVGGTFIKYQSALRLAERWTVADTDQTVLTCPNLAAAQQQTVFLIRSRQIDLERRSSRKRGTGRAFESLREYQPGDETRDICWTASARRGKAVTKLYEIERSQTIWTLLDAGRLMRARADGLSKLDHGVNAVLALAQVAINSGDRIGVLAYGRRIALRLPAARGAAHLRQMVDGLSRVREDEWEADHLQAASRVLADQSRRSLVVWITDLAETTMTPEVIRAASALMTRHVVLFVAIGNPDVHVVAARPPRTPNELFETAAAREVVDRRERLLARLREGGALALETTAAGLSVAVVNGYLDVKQRNRF